MLVEAPSKPLCIVCGTNSMVRKIFDKWNHPIFQCDSCGLGFTGVQKDFDPSKIYNEGYFEGAHKDGYADYQGSELVLRAEFKKTAEYLHRNGVSAGKLLEVGCAYGYFLKEAQKYFQCTGVEISEAAVQQCRAQGLEVFAGTVEGARANLEKRGPFDAVVLLDCIEHLKEPEVVLKEIRPFVKSGAFLVLTTGDWGSFLSQLMGRHWRLMTPPQHLFFFSRKSLKGLLNQAGFEVIEFSSPWKFVPIGLALYQIMQRLGLKFKLPQFLNKLAIPVNLFDTVRVLAKAR